MNDIITVPLAKPLTYGQDTLKQLQLRRPMAGDLRGIRLAGLSDMDVDVVTKIASRCCITVVTEAHLAELDPYDLVKVTEAVGGFFADAPHSQTTPAAPGQS
ncbi:phage tail assembly protein (plasmid) [Azospirillum sp. HJ39]|uniref:phage tail assembly protein n=1 Tax=Azospirillum sp. HJ39 TaxID=3159496 RepID=UPI0035564F26